MKIVMGGFPVLSLLSGEEGIGGEICGAILVNNERMIQEIISSKEGTESLVTQCREKLPALFALLHFHMEYLRKGKSVAVVTGSDMHMHPYILGWLEVLQNKLIVYRYLKNFKVSDKCFLHTGYCII